MIEPAAPENGYITPLSAIPCHLRWSYSSLRPRRVFMPKPSPLRNSVTCGLPDSDTDGAKGTGPQPSPQSGCQQSSSAIEKSSSEGSQSASPALIEAILRLQRNMSRAPRSIENKPNPRRIRPSMVASENRSHTEESVKPIGYGRHLVHQRRNISSYTGSVHAKSSCGAAYSPQATALSPDDPIIPSGTMTRKPTTSSRIRVAGNVQQAEDQQDRVFFRYDSDSDLLNLLLPQEDHGTTSDVCNTAQGEGITKIRPATSAHPWPPRGSS